MVSPLSIGDPNRRDRRRREREARRLAEQARLAGTTPLVQQPTTPLGQQGEQSLQRKTDRTSPTVLGRLERPQQPKTTLSRIGSAISFTADTAASLAFQTITRNELLRRIVESSPEIQKEKGGVGTDTPTYKLIGNRRREPSKRRKKFLQANRQYYLEAKDNKEFRRGAAFTTEVLFDPLTYLGVGTVSKVFKAGQAGAKEDAGTKSFKRILSEQKVADRIAEKTINKQGLNKLTERLKTVPFLGPMAMKFTKVVRGQNYTIDTTDSVQKRLVNLIFWQVLEKTELLVRWQVYCLMLQQNYHYQED